jgi:translation initiation factor 1A
MPNKKGGKKFKKGKKNTSQFQRKLIIKNEADGVDDQEYAKVLKVNGSGRFRILCFDGKERMGTICGKMRKRVWVNLNDVVLVSLWTGIQDDKCTIIHKYDMDEAYKLKDMGQFPVGITLEENEDEDDDLFTMLNPSSSSSEEEENTDYFAVDPGVSGTTDNVKEEDFNFDDI